MAHLSVSSPRKLVSILVPCAILLTIAEICWLLPRRNFQTLSTGTINHRRHSTTSTRSQSATPELNDLERDEEIEIDYEEPTPEWYELIDFVNHYNKECAGKERLLEILLRAGKKKFSVEDCEILPYWAEVTSLYGDEPVVYGLETCEAYRSSLYFEGNPLDADPRVAGLFNSGTDAFATLLRLNFRDETHKRKYNVLGGKNIPYEAKARAWAWNHSRSNRTTTIPLPIVIIRDPFRWMNSMCESSYKSHWMKGLNGHCPNLVPSREEGRKRRYKNLTTFTVNVDFEGANVQYDSLADMWSIWYRQNADSKIPCLMVRFEDMLFHTEKVMQLVTECMGIPMDPPIQYHLSARARRGSTSDLAMALATYGREEGRYGNMTDEDKEYTISSLDAELMQKFHYPQAPIDFDVKVQESVQALVASSEKCIGKEKLLEILIRAGKLRVTVEDCEMLPVWSEVTRLYGENPIVYGLDTCSEYRSTLSVGGKTRDPKPRVGGLYNTGTNAFVDSLGLNFEKLDDRLDYNLPGGKHQALEFRRDNVSSLTQDILPIILIRDPMRWMRAMCKVSYDANWTKGLPGHCPNLVPSETEKQLLQYSNRTTFEVHVADEVRYKSLADMWSEWNRQYFDLTSPRLIIRFEDTLFHAEKVMQLVSECVGRPMQKRFRYKLKRAKDFKLASNFVSAMRTYGKEEGRYDGLTVSDAEYAKEVLDKELLSVFHYRSVPDISTDLAIRNQLDELFNRYSRCRGKERLLEILVRAGRVDINETDCDRLPFWSEVEALYGGEPAIHGLETCKDYRDFVASKGMEPKPRVGGLVNAGTNAFINSLMVNFGGLDDELDYDMTGGKHSSLTEKAKGDPEWFVDDVLPIILVRDPFRWMAAMCKLPYKAKWMDGLEDHCPNLVPSSEELDLESFQNLTSFEVEVGSERYASLADMWSDWYGQYDRAHFPRLIIRFEDTLFHAEKVMEAVSECLGKPMLTKFQYQLDNAQGTSLSSDFTTAIVQYGREEGRYMGVKPQDLDYARKALDPVLMEKFRYPPVPVEQRPAVDVRITRLVSKHVTCRGKEHLLEILLNAGRQNITSGDCEMLPPWKEITTLYGEEPVVYGLETCERFRSNLDRLNKTGDVVTPVVRVAGLFNTGTNALAQSLFLNINNLDPSHMEPDFYDLPGGKHVPPKEIWLRLFEKMMENRTKVLPVVLVRDPMRWMQSMCKIGYNAKWKKGLKGRCPNLVPTEEEERHPLYRNMSTDTFEVAVSIKGQYYDNYTSLADMWSEWNRLYYDADYPRLLIRFEDTLYHADKVMALITKCAGVPMERPFRYHLEGAKRARSSADFLTALSKYGRKDGRLGGLMPRDMEYLRVSLDPELMRVFHYPAVGPIKFKNQSSGTQGALETDHR